MTERGGEGLGADPEHLKRHLHEVTGGEVPQFLEDAVTQGSCHNRGSCLVQNGGISRVRGGEG